ncbi:MAG: hypothetical protein ACLUB5_04925 [Bifidobacterium dentium]
MGQSPMTLAAGFPVLLAGTARLVYLLAVRSDSVALAEEPTLRRTPWIPPPMPSTVGNGPIQLITVFLIAADHVRT